MRHPDHGSGERGYSLMEVTIVLLAGVTVLLVVFGMIEEATKASLFVESHNELAQLAQLPVNRVQEEILQSRTVFLGDAIGNAYATRMLVGVATAWRPIADYKLPLQDSSTDSVVPDTGTGTSRLTGNVLLIARQLPPLLIPYDHDDDTGTPDIRFVADRYRFQMYYLRRDVAKGFRAVMDDGTFQRYGYIHDLVEVRSAVYADFFQLSTIFAGPSALTVDQRNSIINGLAAEGITRAWNAGQNPVGTSFFTIVAGGTLNAIPAHNPVIVSTESMMNLKQPGISGKLDYTVAMNPPISGPEFRVPAAIPRYALRDSAAPEFPGGLEFKIVGAGGNLKVMMRLLLFSNYGGGKMDAGEGVVLAQAG